MGLSRIVALTSKNVFTNLAAEQRLFERTSGHMLVFYVNSPCVVMGRTQNPFVEVDVSRAVSENVPIARRRSGGGTVVHDEGNLNVCFIRPRAEHDPCANAKLLAGTLRDEFGVQAVVNKRGDILVDGAKVSGSAYRLSSDRAYHHATLLINSNLPRLRMLLKSPLKDRLDAMGTKSVTSQVTNLAECTNTPMDTLSVMQAIANRWRGIEEVARVQSLSPSQVEREVGGMQGERGEICSHSWVFGQTPKFSLHATPLVGTDQSGNNRPAGDDDTSTRKVQIVVRKGQIVDRVHLTHSKSDQRVEDAVSSVLEGRRFDPPSLTNALEGLPQGMEDDDSVLALKRIVAEIPVLNWGDEDQGSVSAEMMS